ncbi:MAG: winged helix DNA-binding domain-containing protein [Acidothermales bacterium]|nr:winged helix DNA-binding domain-containing protein [Acidothermales bacterium]
MSSVDTIRVRWWSYRRQRLGRSAGGLLEALRHVVGVYSVHPTAPLSLAARVAAFSAGAFRRLEAERTALMLPAMRGCGYLLPRETAHLAFHSTRRPVAQHRWRIRDAGISPESYEVLRRAVLAAAREPRSARQLRADIGAEQSLTPVLQTMAFEGSLLKVGNESLRSNAMGYVAADAWLGGGLPPAEPGGALAWLAGEYLRAFGPAREEDFRWWAGRPAREAAVALSRVETVALDGGYLLPAADLERFETVTAPAGGSLDLLPKWDAYTMGYAPDGRERFVDPEVQARVFDSDGNGLGVVLVDGLAAGAWSARFAGERMEVRLDMFAHSMGRLRKAIADRFQELAGLLGGRGVTVEPVDAVGRRAPR